MAASSTDETIPPFHELFPNANGNTRKVNMANFGLVLIRVPSWFDLVTPKRCLNIPEVQRGPYTHSRGGISAT